MTPGEKIAKWFQDEGHAYYDELAEKIDNDLLTLRTQYAELERERDQAQADARELARVLERNVSDFKKVNYMLRESGYHGFDLAVKESEQALTEHGAKYLPQEEGR